MGGGKGKGRKRVLGLGKEEVVKRDGYRSDIGLYACEQIVHPRPRSDKSLGYYHAVLGRFNARFPQ